MAERAGGDEYALFIFLGMIHAQLTWSTAANIDQAKLTLQ